MDIFRTTSKASKNSGTSGRSARFAKSGLALGLAMTLTLAGCSGGSPDQGAGDEASSGSAPRTSQAAPETTGPGDARSTPETTPASTTGQGTANNPEDSGGVTALSGGLGEARQRAESWNDDAELYGIASLRATVNAEGKNEGWLYSFVSESTGSVISVPYVDGQLRNAQGQELPEGQIRRIVDDTLSISELVDSPEAMRRSDEVRSYLQENPGAGASAGLDSGSGDEAEWILIISSETLQERVPAAK
jgi:hypothetical protein